MPWVAVQVRLFESVNFMEFVKLLAPFSSRATNNMKLELMFKVRAGMHRPGGGGGVQRRQRTMCRGGRAALSGCRELAATSTHAPGWCLAPSPPHVAGV